MAVDDPEVNAVRDVKLDISKKDRSDPETWQPFMCFELNVPSPYLNDGGLYTPFNTADPPVCTTDTEGAVISSCTLKDANTLQFYFESFTEEASRQTALKVRFNKF